MLPFTSTLLRLSLAFALGGMMLGGQGWAAAPGADALAAVIEKGRAHWAFQPLSQAVPPALAAHETQPIDAFVQAKWREAGLTGAAPASREVLIRRVALDLIGLPPTPAEVQAFVEDASPKAYERLVERLLASPQYGERWARHWLDLARYAETDGFEHDAIRPHTWRYRDYVIRSFNEDKPYDRFIREQLAGDEFWPGDPDALIATGFNLLGPDMVDSSDQVQRHHNTLNDMTDTVGQVFLGLTVGCARCHDHKLEPISQKDYYSLQAFFTPAKFVRDQPVPTPEAMTQYEHEKARFDAYPQVRELAALEAPVREHLRERKLAKLAPEAQVAHRTAPENRNAEQANLVLETEDKVLVKDSEVAAAFKGDESKRHHDLLDQVKLLPHAPALPKAMALKDGDHAEPTFILRRGEYSQPLEEVKPGYLSVLQSHPNEKGSVTSRKELADWLASPANPVTARVMVNRIWQHHFGRGLVATPSEFGTHGARPSHPELLDWLAHEFINSGWSVKHMHRLMLLSETYQLSSSGGVDTQNADPANQYLRHMNRLRLEGEVIRDSLLAISGQLNPQMGGPGVFPPIPKEAIAGAKGWTVSHDPKDSNRRSIYIFVRRNLRFPFLEVFDAPDNNLSCPARERSVTAPQSLTLLNADQVMQASEETAQRLQREAPDEKARVVLAYRLILGRAPQAEELMLSQSFLQKSPMRELCRVLFNLNDFVYVE